MLKRITIATLVGVGLGIICWLAGVLVGLIENPSTIRVANIIAHRAIMGFVIGISALPIHWAAHGIVLGSVIGALFILFDAFAGMPLFVLFGMLIPANAAYGFVIEFVTTKLCKAPHI